MARKKLRDAVKRLQRRRRIFNYSFDGGDETRG